MKKSSVFIFSLVLLMSLSNCSQKLDTSELHSFSKNQLNVWNKVVTDVMILDIFSPPEASRVFAYPNIAAYEVLSQIDSSYRSLSKTISHLQKVPLANDEPSYFYEIAAVIAYAHVAEKMVYTFEMIAEKRVGYLEKLRSLGVSESELKKAIVYGEKVGNHILDWARKDGYKERNNNSQILKDMGTGTWMPTPPDFMEPIEPNWNSLRTFVIDSSKQFSPGEPTDFDTDKDSQFYKECVEVYDKVKNATKEEIEIAQFWDCNPNASQHHGREMNFTQKISPGAHWMLIASQVIQQKDLSMLERSKVFAYVSLTLADSFISCWDEKYRTVVIRPETYINRYIDKNWRPILQTPPFPEYTSGHSVASGSSATILTKLLGDNVQFIDSTEVEFGLPIRAFPSFHAAANEAAISRLYGGIHYMPAITNGVSQGRQIGDYIADKLFQE